MRYLKAFRKLLLILTRIENYCLEKLEVNIDEKSDKSTQIYSLSINVIKQNRNSTAIKDAVQSLSLCDI